MLLYNQRKEFIGVDNESLSELGFLNIAELQNESHDFADLFVKKPGFIHNFKNFSWIDFILHSESADDPKAVIHAKGKNFACNLHVTPFSFSSGESGFSIELKNLRVLKGVEDEQALKDIAAAGGIQSSPALEPRATTPVVTAEKKTHETDISFDDIKSAQNKEENPEVATQEPELPNFEESYTQELSEPEPFDIPESQEVDLGFQSEGENEFGAPTGIDYSASLTLDDDVMQDIEKPTFEEPLLETESDVSEQAPMLGDYVSSNDSEYLSDLIKSGSYIYDPQIAANELGLPVDLIEEFIGDFIDQANEFHDDLFASVRSGDFDNVQNLSHKLKGVAANLRVEDAFDTLTVVNSSKDIDQILPNLNCFYKIISKLDGKEAPQSISGNAQVSESVSPADVQDDTVDFDIKQPEDGPLLIDEDTLSPNDDEMYNDLLASPEEDSYVPEPATATPDVAEDDDLYGDLLASPEEESYIPEPAATPDVAEDDDLYGDLLASPEEESYVPEPAATPDVAEDDDLYGDLLSTPESVNENPVTDEMQAPASFDEESLIEPEYNSDLEMQTPLEDSQDLYTQTDDLSAISDEYLDDNILSTSDDLVSSEEETPPAPAIATLNFDSQRTANELGIPLDIVNEFIQDFKEQVHTHQNNFDEATATENIKKINQTATLLKGMSDNLRLTEISEVLKVLQQEDDINNTAQALATLYAYVDQI